MRDSDSSVLVSVGDLLRIEDIIALIMSSPAPVEIKFADGRISRALIKGEPEEMMASDISVMLRKIQDHYQHGTLTAKNDGGKIIVQWEQSVIISERR